MTNTEATERRLVNRALPPNDLAHYPSVGRKRDQDKVHADEQPRRSCTGDLESIKVALHTAPELVAALSPRSSQFIITVILATDLEQRQNY